MSCQERLRCVVDIHCIVVQILLLLLLAGRVSAVSAGGHVVEAAVVGVVALAVVVGAAQAAAGRAADVAGAGRPDVDAVPLGIAVVQRLQLVCSEIRIDWLARS